MRRLAALIVVPVLLGSAAAAGCGGGPTSLGVTLSIASAQDPSIEAGQIESGQVVDFVITVTDAGAAGTSGVTVTADLPADFRYSDTLDLGGSAVRTTPVYPQGNSQDPSWGVWELAGYGDNIMIQFEAVAGGSPGPWSMTASASGSTTDTAQSSPLKLTLLAAPQLSANVTVTPGNAVPGQDVTYTVTVLNTGSGQAKDVSVLVTLPPVFAFDGGIEITGNSGRSGGMDPIEGSELPFFDGFVLPPANGSTPGELKLQFNAQVQSGAGADGSYPVGVQVLGDAGLERVTIPESAPVTVG